MTKSAKIFSTIAGILLIIAVIAAFAIYFMQRATPTSDSTWDFAEALPTPTVEWIAGVEEEVDADQFTDVNGQVYTRQENAAYLNAAESCTLIYTLLPGSTEFPTDWAATQSYTEVLLADAQESGYTVSEPVVIAYGEVDLQALIIQGTDGRASYVGYRGNHATGGVVFSSVTCETDVFNSDIQLMVDTLNLQVLPKD